MTKMISGEYNTHGKLGSFGQIETDEQLVLISIKLLVISILRMTSYKPNFVVLWHYNVP